VCLQWCEYQVDGLKKGTGSSDKPNFFTKKMPHKEFHNWLVVLLLQIVQPKLSRVIRFTFTQPFVFYARLPGQERAL
jgi:hypothetical protein